MGPTRVVLADDHTLVREGIKGLIQARMPELDICAEASDGLEALKACREHQPHLLLLDISMPEMTGLEVLAELPSTSPHTKVLMISQHSEPAFVMRALRLGAKGYLPKKAAGRDLVSALQAVMDGRTWLDPSVASVVVEAAMHPGDPQEAPELAGLTVREREVLKLTGEGGTAKDVASALGISIHTANRHRSNLMEKLGAHSKAELVRIAIRLGMVDA